MDQNQLDIDFETIRATSKEYPLADMYNMDETALYYRSSSDNSLSDACLPTSGPRDDQTLPAAKDALFALVHWLRWMSSELYFEV